MANPWYRTFKIDGVLVAFEQMRKTEGLCVKRLFEALADNNVSPSTSACSLEQAREEYNNLGINSPEETAALKQLARYYPTSIEDEAIAPKLDYGRDSERRMVTFHNNQRVIKAAGGPTNSTQLLNAKKSRKPRRAI